MVEKKQQQQKQQANKHTILTQTYTKRVFMIYLSSQSEHLETDRAETQGESGPCTCSDCSLISALATRITLADNC